MALGLKTVWLSIITYNWTNLEGKPNQPKTCWERRMSLCIRKMWIENNSGENKSLKPQQRRKESARFSGYQGIKEFWGLVLREVQPHLLQAVSRSPFLCCLAKISKAWIRLGLTPMNSPVLWGQGCQSEQGIFSWEHPPTSLAFLKVPGTVLYILLGVWSGGCLVAGAIDWRMSYIVLRSVCSKRCWAWVIPPDLVSTPAVNKKGMLTSRAISEQCCMWIQ